jgi:hypothetical protein
MCPIILTAFTCILFMRKTSINNQSNLLKIFNYLTLDYTDSCFYWEIFTYFSKFIVAGVTILSSFYKPESQGAILIFIFILMFIIQEYMQPFKYLFINELKRTSYLVSICTMSFAIMASNPDISNLQRTIYLWALILFNVYFFLKWIFYKVKELIDKCKKNK